MREIKFRAKRIDTGRWVHGHYFKTPLSDENSGTTPDAGWFFLTGETRHCIGKDGVAFVIDEKTLGQYTGLKDKNGKEIYEGDILDDDTEMIYGNESCGCCSTVYGYDLESHWLEDGKINCEITGNIYEKGETNES